jgi:hypothetical protein
MAQHAHQFVEAYSGLVGFGLNRTTNENTVVYYLQKFSDDTLMETLKSRMSDEDLTTLFDTLSGLLRKHLSEQEYHQLFLKNDE